MTREEFGQRQSIEEQIFQTIHDESPELFLVCSVSQASPEESNTREE